MPRSQFGGSVADVVTNAAGDVQASVDVKFWDAPTAGTQYTDLLEIDGATAIPGGVVTTDAEGFLRRFLGPDAVTSMWAQAGTGTRRLMPTSTDPVGTIDSHLGGDATNLVPQVQSNTSDLAGKVDTAAAGYVMPTLPLTITTLQAAADSAASSGARLVASGSITTATRLTLACDADLGELTFNYTGGGAAVRIGSTTSSVQRITVRAPQVLAANKAATGWTEVAGTVGVELANLYASKVDVPLVRGFESGLQFKGYGPSGTAYVNVALGHLDNNQRNMVFTADSTGYANQNTVVGGRCSHNSNEGTVVVGTRHVLFVSTANPINNNTLVGTSLESPNAVEYHFECYGQDNYLIGCRWENTGANARVMWRANSKGNAIIYGFGSGSLTESVESGVANDIITRQQHRFMGGNSANPTVVLENSFSSGAPSLVGMGAGSFAASADPSTAWSWRFNASALSGKSAADTEDRVRLDFPNSRVYLGPGGATAPTVYLGKTTVGLVSSGPMQVGAYATGSRPSASAAGAGAMAFDTTLGKPIWSDGTTWRDATGTAV